MTTRRVVLVATLGVFAMLGSAPAHEHGLEAAARIQEQHDHNHGAVAEAQEKTSGMCASMMAGMKATDAKLEALTQTMNAARGEAKVDAAAAILTTLVEERRAMHASMGNGMGDGSMMKTMMGGSGMMGSGSASEGKSDAPKK